MAQLPFKNIDLFNPSLAGKIDYAFDTPYAFQDVLETETKKSTAKKDPLEAVAGMTIGGFPIADFKKFDSETKNLILMKEMIDENRKENDPEILRRRRREEIEDLDELQARQMARAQKYGKESAMYGFFYQGLPNLMAQAAFSRYAFAPEAVKGVQDAYRRINLAQAVKPQGGQSYMSLNPMG